MQNFILQQHQTAAVELAIQRDHDPVKRRGLVWHTQGSGKTFTMLKTAELLFKVPNHGKLWKNLMQAHLGNYESLEVKLKKHGV